MVGVLDWMEGLTRVQYCRRCFGVARGVSALRSLTRLLAQLRLCERLPQRAMRPWPPPLRPRLVPLQLE